MGMGMSVYEWLEASHSSSQLLQVGVVRSPGMEMKNALAYALLILAYLTDIRHDYIYHPMSCHCCA